jgi:protein-disulfide isomerase
VNRRLFVALSLLLAFGIAGTLLFATTHTTQTPPPAKTKPVAKPAAPPQVSTATITVNGVTDIDPAKAFGSKNAPVVMEIFSDFQCPSCKQLFTTTTQRVMDNYVTGGKVYIVHRDFPLPMHAYSRIAASYSRAAAHIGKCEPVELALFQNQERWEIDGKIQETVASVLSPADMKRVQAIVDAKTLEPLIIRDQQLGQSHVVNQTPTSIIYTKDGQSYPVIGYVSYDVLKTLLDQLVK